jgi:hypothetical protein
VALAAAGCDDGGPRWADPPGTISGTTFDAATGSPTSTPIVVALHQSDSRSAQGSGVQAQPRQVGTYEITVPPGTYTVQCYMEHQGEQYPGDKIENVVVRSNQNTAGQDLTAPSVIAADSYVSDGVLISSWHWIRDGGYLNSSTWGFSGIERNRDVTAHFLLLVTNTINGGAGYDTTIDVEYTGNHGPTSVDLYLPPSGSPPDNQPITPFPEGYVTRAAQNVNQNFVTTGGDLDIEVSRISPNPEHIATSQQSVWLVNY